MRDKSQGEPPLTSKQVDLAARLYTLAVQAQGDNGGAQGEDQERVLNRARERAMTKLEQMGYDPPELTTLAACVLAARLSSPGNK